MSFLVADLQIDEVALPLAYPDDSDVDGKLDFPCRVISFISCFNSVDII